MHRSRRHQTIISALPRTGAITVTALCRLTGVSAVTIRRDLTALELQGALVRRHGGASRPARRGDTMSFAIRWDEDREHKQRLASVVADLVTDEESVILDNGTTCYAVAQHLAGRPITALVLSLHAAAALAASPGARVVVPGGPVETDSLAFIGSSALDAVRTTFADVAVIGACSASPAHGLTSTTHEDATLKRAIIAGSRRRVLVATAAKLARTSTFRFGVLSDLTHLITTTDAPSETVQAYQEAGVQVHLV